MTTVEESLAYSRSEFCPVLRLILGHNNKNSWSVFRLFLKGITTIARRLLVSRLCWWFSNQALTVSVNCGDLQRKFGSDRWKLCKFRGQILTISGRDPNSFYREAFWRESWLFLKGISMIPREKFENFSSRVLKILEYSIGNMSVLLRDLNDLWREESWRFLKGILSIHQEKPDNSSQECWWFPNAVLTVSDGSLYGYQREVWKFLKGVLDGNGPEEILPILWSNLEYS